MELYLGKLYKSIKEKNSMNKINNNKILFCKPNHIVKFERTK